MSTAINAFKILKKNLNAYDMKELIPLLEAEIEKQVQEAMKEQFGEDK